MGKLIFSTELPFSAIMISFVYDTTIEARFSVKRISSSIPGAINSTKALEWLLSGAIEIEWRDESSGRAVPSEALLAAIIQWLKLNNGHAIINTTPDQAADGLTIYQCIHRQISDSIANDLVVNPNAGSWLCKLSYQHGGKIIFGHDLSKDKPLPLGKSESSKEKTMNKGALSYASSEQIELHLSAAKLKNFVYSEFCPTKHIESNPLGDPLEEVARSYWAKRQKEEARLDDYLSKAREKWEQTTLARYQALIHGATEGDDPTIIKEDHGTQRITAIGIN